MSLSFEVQVERTARAISRQLERERRAFRRDQRRRMGQALNLMRREVRARIRTTFTRRTGRFARSVSRSIRRRGDVIVGTVYLGRRAYYGVHEAGRPEVGLPARPVWAPAAEARAGEAVNIVGQSFDVFTSRGRVGR